ncbi:MAG: flavodoxin family protein [Thermodesulfobacteriota bacterium]
MKVLAISGSPRKNGNTDIMIRRVFQELEKEGIETELHQLAGRRIHGCVACFKCFEKADRRCSFDDDALNECLAKMFEADGLILGTPTYFADLTPEIKCLIDRAGMVSLANGNPLRRKIGAAVVAARRGGAIHAFDSLNHFFLFAQMIIPGSNYWNMGFGLDKGEVEKDEEGLTTMAVLGQNMAWLLKKIND